ncbi:MAG: HAD family hydrolase [Candidatus Melainabacteria bacterium]|nr:HAD family hydrolase [Candidatus Melainabacteria bacterium]
MSPSQKPVVFLDRDGTLNVESGYIRDLNDLQLIDGAADAVRKLNSSGIAAVLITNQTGAARGYYSEDHIRNLNAKLVKLLKDQQAFLDDVYYCPHLPDGTVEQYTQTCDCRKPAPGLVEQAYNEHPELDRTRSFVVGDKATDVELASNCGAKSILVETGYGKQVQAGEYQWKVTPDYQTDSIVEAVEWILNSLKSS